MSFRRSVLAQMIICGIIALLGPGLWVSKQLFLFFCRVHFADILQNANNSLGAGGALEPYLVRS